MDIQLGLEIASTWELCGGKLSETSKGFLLEDLNEYDPTELRKALARCRKECSGRITIGDIVSRIDDGRPGVEEAWATIDRARRDSGSTFVWTDDMASAFGHIENMEDDTAARMSFKECYKRICDEARSRHDNVTWRASLGRYEGREGPLLEAVRTGKIKTSTARRLVPELPPMDEEMPFLPPSNNERSLDIDDLCNAVVDNSDLNTVGKKK